MKAFHITILLMPKQPLGEVFGFPINNNSADAIRNRTQRLCPFNNKVANCTKDKVIDPLGVCSVREGDSLTITCPVRFRERWLIATDTAGFFFPPDAKWTSLVEVKLNDKYGKSAGNIDVVLVSYDDRGKIIDFGSCEVQAVYISGNIRSPFAHFMEDPPNRSTMDWTGQPNYPHADYLSSSRKRLAPQLLFKGGILHSWGKKQAVAVDRAFFNTLPTLSPVAAGEAELALFVYDLIHDSDRNVYELLQSEIVYTKFAPAMLKLTTTEAGPIDDFIGKLQAKLDVKLDGNSPDAPALNDIILS